MKISFILASGSPRRLDLLSRFIHPIHVVTPNVEEKRKKNETPLKYVQRLAEEKAYSAFNLFQPEVKPIKKKRSIFLAADTIVILGNSNILEKPQSPDHAKLMLKDLQGKWHTVLTGYCILEFTQGKMARRFVGHKKTRVKIAKLSNQFIATYVKTKEPMDKAGSYAAQGYGVGFIEHVNGSYSNVVGLPLSSVLMTLQNKFGFSPWKSRLGKIEETAIKKSLKK